MIVFKNSRLIDILKVKDQNKTILKIQRPIEI